MTRAPYLPAADLVRAAAIIAVVAVHVTSVPVTSLPADSSFYLVYLTANILGKLGVPVFILLNGFMLFYAYADRPPERGWVADFYRRKAAYIVLPYLAWSLFYHLYAPALRGSVRFDGSLFLNQLFIGRAYYHIYFMVIIIQFYVLFPFLLMLVKKKGLPARHFFVIGLVLQWAFYFYNRYFWQFEYKSRLSLSYFSFFAFGAFSALHYDRLSRYFGNRRLILPAFLGWGLAIAWNTMLYYNAYTRGIYASGVWFETAWNVLAFSSFIFLWPLSDYIRERFRGRVVQAAAVLGQVSFGVYLLHPALLSLLRRIPPSPRAVVYHGVTALQFLVVLAASALIVYLLQRTLPFTDYILGKSKVTRGRQTVRKCHQ